MSSNPSIPRRFRVTTADGVLLTSTPRAIDATVYALNEQSAHREPLEVHDTLAGIQIGDGENGEWPAIDNLGLATLISATDDGLRHIIDELERDRSWTDYAWSDARWSRWLHATAILRDRERWARRAAEDAAMLAAMRRAFGRGDYVLSEAGRASAPLLPSASCPNGGTLDHGSDSEIGEPKPDYASKNLTHTFTDISGRLQTVELIPGDVIPLGPNSRPAVEIGENGTARGLIDGAPLAPFVPVPPEAVKRLALCKVLYVERA